MSDDKRGPSTVEEARQVLAMRGMVWIGTMIGALCLVLAFSSAQIGREGDNGLLMWGGPLLFGGLAVAWVIGVRRLRGRVSAARELLARES